MVRVAKNQRSDKREKIIATAIALFSRFGAKRVTVEELCREAGTSKMTFYKHFSNKVNLVRIIHDELVEEAFAKYDEINSRNIPFPQKIELMGRWKAEFVSRINADFFRELIDVEHSMEELKRRYLQNIIEAQGAGDVRSDIHPEFLWLVMEKLGELFREDKWRAVLSDYSQLQTQARTLIWKGLLDRPSTEEIER